MLVLLQCAQKPDDIPISVVRKFLKAGQRGDCETMWSLLTAEDRSAIEAGNDPKLPPHRDAAGHLGGSQKYEFCGWARFEFEPDQVTLVAMEADRAQVSVLEKFGRDFLIPGFFPRKYDCAPRKLALLKEQEGWRINYDSQIMAAFSERRPCAE